MNKFLEKIAENLDERYSEILKKTYGADLDSDLNSHTSTLKKPGLIDKILGKKPKEVKTPVFDDVDKMDMLMSAEELFNKSIPDHVISSAKTPRDLLTYLKNPNTK